jgi:hypothetical protein
MLSIEIHLLLILGKGCVIDAPQSGLKGLPQTLNKTIKMCYNAQVRDSTLVAKTLGMSQE